jgi:hypothetical protein
VFNLVRPSGRLEYELKDISKLTDITEIQSLFSENIVLIQNLPFEINYEVFKNNTDQENYLGIYLWSHFSIE